MITEIFGPPKRFKTFYLTCKALEIMRDKTRYKSMLAEVELLKKQGINFNLTNNNCVASNFEIINKTHGGGFKKSYPVNPYKLCLPNGDIPFTLFPPYFSFFIMEGQSYYNSRKSKKFRMEVIQWFANHGHSHFDIFIDTHRPGALDVYVRDLAMRVATVLDVKHVKDSQGHILKHVVKLLEFNDTASAESYCDSGDKKLGRIVKEVYPGNIFKCYNGFENKKAFFQNCSPCDVDYENWENITSAFLLPPDNYYEK